MPIYPPWRRSQIEEQLLRQAGILTNAQARLLVTIPEARPAARLLHLRVPALRRLVTPEELAVAPRGRSRPAGPACRGANSLLHPET